MSTTKRDEVVRDADAELRDVIRAIARESQPLPDGDLVDRFIRSDKERPADGRTSDDLVCYWTYLELCVAEGQLEEYSADPGSFLGRKKEVTALTNYDSQALR